MARIQREVLHRRWVHAHEEDTDDEMVFRPAEYELPPARGRMAFELRPDGTFSEAGIGPADLPDRAQGTWDLTADESIVLGEGAPGGVPRIMPIAAADEQRLAIKK